MRLRENWLYMVCGGIHVRQNKTTKRPHMRYGQILSVSSQVTVFKTLPFIDTPLSPDHMLPAELVGGPWADGWFYNNMSFVRWVMKGCFLGTKNLQSRLLSLFYPDTRWYFYDRANRLTSNMSASKYLEALASFSNQQCQWVAQTPSPRGLGGEQPKGLRISLVFNTSENLGLKISCDKMLARSLQRDIISLQYKGVKAISASLLEGSWQGTNTGDHPRNRTNMYSQRAEIQVRSTKRLR